MASAEDECATYEHQALDCSNKPAVVDASVQLNLIEECEAQEKLEPIQSYPTGFIDLDMKLPMTIQNCIPLNMQISSELVVIANNGGFLEDQKIPLAPIRTIEEPLSKRICIEQDGQTYILQVQDTLDNLTGIVELRGKTAPNVDVSQLINGQENLNDGGKDGINQNWFTSKLEKTTLHNKGHIWKQGMWSKEEIELLERNIQVYCSEHSISDPAIIIFEMSKDERKDFYRTVAKGLNRPLFSVYRRLIRMYDNKNHVGKYTADELEKLKRLRSIHGNNWQSIGSAMGRSASSIKDRCRLMKDNCNQGKWLPAEERRLAEAVYDMANALPGEMISSGLSWAVVAQRVGSRSEKQCRTKWLNYLNWKEAGGTEWTREDDITLICRVYALSATDENHVDWTELAKGWLSCRSPQWLRGKWWSMKRFVPNANIVSFREICEHLYQQFVVRLSLSEEGSCSSSSEGTEENNTFQAQIISHPKPTIVHALPTTTAPIVVSSVPQGLENAAFNSVRVGPMLQTLEVLPQNVQIATTSPAFMQSTPPTLPLTTLPPNQIIIQTVTANGLHGESIQVELSEPQIVINAMSPAALTSLASTQIPSAPPSPDAASMEETHVLIDDGHYVNEAIEEHSSLHEELDDDGHENMCENGPSSHIILSDPMLAGSTSSDIATSDVESES